MVAIALLVILVALGAATVLGVTPDTRDPEYGPGAFFLPPAKHDGPERAE